MPDNPTTRRLFFALWPDDEVRHQVSQHIMPNLQSLNGRKVSQPQWHITLAFLGNVTDEVMQCAIEQANQITSAPFEIELDVVGHWSRPKVVWLGCHDRPKEMQSLVTALNSELKQCSYEPEYQDFKPHMTLMRKVTRKPKPFQFEPIQWHLKQFVLVESQVDNSGSSYKIINQWNLC